MEIKVYPKKQLKHFWYSDRDYFRNKNRYFISIAGLADGCEFPCPFLAEDSERVLHLLFDDITEQHFINNPYDMSAILFNKDMAKKIHNFIDTIPQNAEIVVNCAAGISRSGAVGYVLNQWFNANNDEDFKMFFVINSQIQPNPTVKRILQYEIFGEPDYSKIFGDK